jgi:release factor glutamine methyltransferase
MSAAAATDRAETRAGLLTEMRARLRAGGAETPDVDARVLLTGLLGIGAKELILAPENSVTEAERATVEAAVMRRLAGEPVHRILGARPFFGLDLRLSPATLEPRPDTEILVEAVAPHVSRIAAKRGACRIADMGTGTGAICLALLSLCPQARGIGVDIAPAALETAAENAMRLGLSSRFETVESDWFQSVADRYDVIVSNPPYIRSGDISLLAREVREHDPRLALDGGPDGLEPYRNLAAGAAAHLSDGAILAVEHGYDQRAAVEAVFVDCGFRVLSRHDDLSGLARAVVFSVADGAQASER